MFLHLPTKFHLNGTTLNGVMTSYRSFKMAATCHKSTCGIGFSDNTRLRR